MSEQRQQTSPDVYYSMRNVTEHQVDDNVIIHLNLNSTYLKVSQRMNLFRTRSFA